MRCRPSTTGSKQNTPSADELPEEIDQRLGEIETALAAFEDRPVVYDPDEIARAGVFVSIDGTGALRVERGYVRPEDEPPVAAEPSEAGRRRPAAGRSEPDGDDHGRAQRTVITIGGRDRADGGGRDGIRRCPTGCVTELTAHRTLALRDARGERSGRRLRRCLHALCLTLFYRYAPRLLPGDRCRAACSSRPRRRA